MIADIRPKLRHMLSPWSWPGQPKETMIVDSPPGVRRACLRGCMPSTDAYSGSWRVSICRCACRAGQRRSLVGDREACLYSGGCVGSAVTWGHQEGTRRPPVPPSHVNKVVSVDMEPRDLSSLLGATSSARAISETLRIRPATSSLTST